MARPKKADERTSTTILILENRQMIASILADLLAGSGYNAAVLPVIAEAQEALHENMPAFLLVDLGMVTAERKAQWQALKEAAKTLSVPILPFSCSPLPEEEEALVLRSPSDFAAVVGRIEEELHKKQPYLGMTLVGMGRLTQEELELALRIQTEMAQIGRQHSLGDLLVRLGFISQEDLEEALEEQER